MDLILRLVRLRLSCTCDQGVAFIAAKFSYHFLMNPGLSSRRCDKLVVQVRQTWIAKLLTILTLNGRICGNQKEPKLSELLMIKIHRPILSRCPCQYYYLASGDVNILLSLLQHILSSINIVQCPKSYLSPSMCPSLRLGRISRACPSRDMRTLFQGILTTVGRVCLARTGKDPN